MDTRTKRDKLRAMASQTVSPEEAEIARRKLEALPPPTTLSKADILAQPNLRADVGSRRVWNPSLRVTVVLDEDDPAFSTTLTWDEV